MEDLILTEEQFNDIRIAASKTKAIGDVMYHIDPEEYWAASPSSGEGLLKDLLPNYGEILMDMARKVDKILTAVEEAEIKRRKEKKEVIELGSPQG
jgi:hypothetical protein